MLPNARRERPVASKTLLARLSRSPSAGNAPGGAEPRDSAPRRLLASTGRRMWSPPLVRYRPFRLRG